MKWYMRQNWTPKVCSMADYGYRSTLFAIGPFYFSITLKAYFGVYRGEFDAK